MPTLFDQEGRYAGKTVGKLTKSKVSSHSGETVTKHQCGTCGKFKKRERFSKDDKMTVPICGDCYAKNYTDELLEILSLIPQSQPEHAEAVIDIFNEMIEEAIAPFEQACDS